MTLGQHIQELRKRAGLSQETLGERLNVSRQAVSKWESDVTIPEVDTLIAMSKLFGVTVGELLQVEQPAETAAEELTERELSAIETIVRRYVEETESRREKAPRPAKLSRRWLLPIAAAALLVILAGSALLNRLENMTDQVNRLQNQLNNLNSNVSSQINGITNQVTELLEEQNSLTVDCGARRAQFDLKNGTVLFEMWAVPKTWQEGMTVTFHVTCGGGVFSVPGTDNGAHRFSASISFPLTDDTVLIDANFILDGVTQTQRLYEDNYLLSDTLPWVEFPSTGLKRLYHESLPSGGEIAFREGEIFVDVFSFGEEQFGKEESLFAGDVPTVTEIKVGLFLNQILIAWLTPTEESLSVAVPENASWSCPFSLQGTSIIFREGDELALAAVISDNYDRAQFIWLDGVTVEENSFLPIAPVDGWELDPEEWDFWE